MKVDMFVEGTDMPAQMTYERAARKSVAMCVSDFAAKGVSPDSYMISLGLPRGVSIRRVRELGRGFRVASGEWGVNFVGGDTNEAKELTIDCAMVGFSPKIVARSGASPGEILVATGRFGLPPSGLKILMDGARSEPAFRKRAVGSVLYPTPNLKLGLAISKFLTSSIDSSDGLSRSVHQLVEQSKVGFEIESVPKASGLVGFARANGEDHERLALVGGEEYLIVGTVKKEHFERARRAALRSGGDLLRVGTVTSKRKVVMVRAGKKESIPDEGWTHLSRGRP